MWRCGAILPASRDQRHKHAARFPRGEDGSETLWGDIETAPPLFMEMAFKQRRQQIVGDCWQLKSDVDSYNDNATPTPRVELLFDFTDDMEEMEIFRVGEMRSA